MVCFTELQTAEAYTASVQQRRKVARTAAIDALSARREAYQAFGNYLKEVRKHPATRVPEFLLVAIKLAEVEYDELTEEARDAHLVRVAVEKELKQAKNAEAEVRLEYHQYLASLGLPAFEVKDDDEASGPMRAWRHQCSRALADYSKMDSVPLPPAKREHMLGCSAGGEKVSEGEICDCTLRAAFLGENRSKTQTTNLEAERLRWVPEKFPERLQDQAGRVFGVCQRMYEEARKA